MSLDTILQIGKTLRESANDKMKHFRYVASPKEDKDGNYFRYITIPIKDDFSFDWENVGETPQYQIDSLYYLNYRTSDSDTSPTKYMFGDIYYQINRPFDKNGKIKGVKESGNYILMKSNAFINAKKTREAYIKLFIPKGTSLSPQSVSKYLEHIGKDDDNSMIQKFVNKNDLLNFWYSFSKNRYKIEQYLTYSPIYDKLKNQIKLEDEYCKYLIENQYDNIKRAITNKNSFEELTEEEKMALSQYANHSVYLHFEFKDKRSWYDIHSCFDVINKMLNEELTSKQQENLLVPTSFIFPTLCSGNERNDIQFPNFNFSNSYKSFAFQGDEFQDFLYTSGIIDDKKGLNKQKMWIKGTSISIYIFPSSYIGQTIKAENYESFFFENKGEQSLFNFDFLNDKQLELFTRFDFVFSDASGNTTKNLIEISGIERSKLLCLRRKIEEKEKEISKEKEEEIGWQNVRMKIEISFTNLLGKYKESNKKGGEVEISFSNEKCPFYKAHMLKILPLIYTNNYYDDEILLTKLIEKVEYSFRKGIKNGNFRLLKYDLKLIYSIQNYIDSGNNINNKYIMEITESKSYQLGVKLGKLSKPLKKAIGSFEKNYVGLLTRRIATKNDCISFTNDICEKLFMHEKVWNTLASEVCSELVALSNADYNKENLAFGYFEGYLKYEPNDNKKSLVSRLEKILSDYEGNEPLKPELDHLRELVEEFNKE